MRTINLTADEMRIIVEDVESTLEYLDLQIRDLDVSNDWAKEEREDAIRDAYAAESILKKLGVR